MYYPNSFSNYIKRNAEVIIQQRIMSPYQYYRMIWTLIVIGEVLGILFLYAIGNDLIEYSLYMSFLVLVVMRLYVIYTILNANQENN